MLENVTMVICLVVIVVGGIVTFDYDAYRIGRAIRRRREREQRRAKLLQQRKDDVSISDN